MNKIHFEKDLVNSYRAECPSASCRKKSVSMTAKQSRSRSKKGICQSCEDWCISVSCCLVTFGKNFYCWRPQPKLSILSTPQNLSTIFDATKVIWKYMCKISCSIIKTSELKCTSKKFMLSKKATKNYKIFTIDLTLTK